jgi:glycosyltransferase involved in cell wall biosynthesis
MVEGEGFGLTVDPTNPESIAEAIQYLLNHPEEAAAMGRRGRQAVRERYNWGVEEAKLLRVYRELLDGNPSRSPRLASTK